MLSINIEPRISESDGLQHISNTVLPVWFEKGREPIFRLFTKNLSFNEWALILAHIDINYKQQIYYQSPVTVHTWIEAIGRTSFTVGHSAEQQDQVCAVGTAVLVHFDYNMQSSEVIPDSIRTTLECDDYKKK